ncbi:hypothetical protein BCR41DRAFT_354382 [Lobosporangium transversale]|uniref:Uncharacterized protein n=1 Tax=Lobosporangium transversale TaxID=64571 RepID=A0A1Y2GLV4_9FUNG|nr:hypothetical protein BCR41DRAFT_354382 [Lobosporangium transversale]ORZ14954.1 hypothetical protein BCR41DRAFT_354382 [Lobosporangium transversale]|eukprot:XP_021881086.1 hypothetical protein BCR41DRAFT_354382 [Lobosporangium transversale]
MDVVVAMICFPLHASICPILIISLPLQLLLYLFQSAPSFSRCPGPPLPFLDHVVSIDLLYDDCRQFPRPDNLPPVNCKQHSFFLVF